MQKNELSGKMHGNIKSFSAQKTNFAPSMYRLLLSLLIGIGIISHTITALADSKAESNPDGKIKGAVVEAQTEKPLEYATVALYSANDDELIDGVITNYLGHFKMDQPDEGNYYLIITFIGLKEIKTRVFQVNGAGKNINLGNFILESTASNLNEVEVVAKQAAIEYRIDKKVINVDKQITAAGGTAVDILENAPSVQVDVEGNVTLRGSSGFSVLIDGKPTILDPSNALRQIPSSSIENIEIITNPSVKYEPDGATGIINIVTKKNRLDGLSGIINANAGLYGQYGGDFQLSYRLNKFNLILGANYNTRIRPGYATDERTTLSNDTSYYVTSEGDSERNHANGSIRAGVEYDISKRDFISLSSRIGIWDMNSSSGLRYDEWTLPETVLYTYNSQDGTFRKGDYVGIDAIYQHTFDSKKTGVSDSLPESPGKPGNVSRQRMEYTPTGIRHILKIEYLFRYRNMDEESTNSLSSLSGETIGGTKNVEKGPSRSTRINVDYTLPVGQQDKFETGLQIRMGNSNDITELWVYNDESGEIEYRDEFSNYTNYYRNIYAVYALYGGIAGNFGYQAGLRTEYMDRKIETVGEDPFTIYRWDYFPTLHLSYSMPLDHQLMTSYSRRIDRPRGWWLEPFITVQDAFNVRQGNPALNPEYIDSYELGYLKNFRDNFFSLEGYYRVTHNKVERIRSVFSENVMMTRPENVGNDYSLGLEGMLTISAFRWWNIELSANFFNYRLDGELHYQAGNEVVTEPIDRSSTNWNSRMNNTFQIWENGVFQLNSRYNSASVTAQGTSKGFFTLDAAFKVSFLNKSLSINLQGMDLLGTSLREWESEGRDFYTHSIFDPKSPMVVVTVSYLFNNYHSKRSAGEEGGEDEF